MASNKRSARAKRRAEFESGFDGAGMRDLFEREHVRVETLEAEHDATVRRRACESKMRYASRADALDAVAACTEHGRCGLSIYRCPHCGGWHLTSHPQNP